MANAKTYVLLYSFPRGLYMEGLISWILRYMKIMLIMTNYFAKNYANTIYQTLLLTQRLEVLLEMPKKKNPCEIIDGAIAYPAL